MTDPRWRQDAPAFGIAIVKLLELQARMLRVEAARRAHRASGMLTLVRKQHG